ncbi:hypothetical protein Vadar_006581 [Vaccinium darrowii]|uniref:Uncharacterized protein n=1 Tax=Vaccinium darrowii TaxID=229202 RepID=A0ACB7XNN1_9ERIC|nr:hypothetical protein Vadar_006581 [Vaccinium darrowii]
MISLTFFTGCPLVQTKIVDFFRIQRSSELTQKLSPGEPRFIYNYAQSKTLKICANHLGRLSRQEPHDTRSQPVQIVRLQETPDEIPKGGTPHRAHTVSLLMHDKLVDAGKPGDRVECHRDL